jgi:hypothetical protein
MAIGSNPHGVAAKRATSAANVDGAAIALQPPGLKVFWSCANLDRIDTIVEMAITYTLTVLRTAPVHFEFALAGLERLRTDLMREVPKHPALERLQSFLGEIAPNEIENALH